VGSCLLPANPMPAQRHPRGADARARSNG
jgi:hypothetical protein